MSTRYQLPVAEDRERPSWNHIKGYEAPTQPLEIPTDDDTYVPVEEPAEPVSIVDAVPVRVVEFAREADRFNDCRTFQLGVGAGKTVALPRRGQRQRLTLVNMDAALNVYIGHDASVNGGTGFPLRPTDPPLVLTAQRSFYLHNADLVSEITVGVIEDFVTELQ